MIKKILLTLFFTSSFFLFADSPDYEKAYNDLSMDYTILENDYDDLQKDYDDLLKKYDDSIKEHKSLINTYSQEVEYHELSKEQIKLDQTEITMLRDNLTTILKIADPKYFTVYFQGGMLVMNQAFDLGLSVQIPRVPFTVMAEGSYVVNEGFGFKIGAGVRF